MHKSEQEIHTEAGQLHLVNKLKLRGLSPPANYTDRATAAYRRTQCKLLPIECRVVSAEDPYGHNLYFYSSSSSIVLTRPSGPYYLLVHYYIIPEAHHD
jgi:hypothetical protein